MQNTFSMYAIWHVFFVCVCDCDCVCVCASVFFQFSFSNKLHTNIFISTLQRKVCTNQLQMLYDSSKDRDKKSVKRCFLCYSCTTFVIFYWPYVNCFALKNYICVSVVLCMYFSFTSYFHC